MGAVLWVLVDNSVLVSGSGSELLVWVAAQSTNVFGRGGRFCPDCVDRESRVV